MKLCFRPLVRIGGYWRSNWRLPDKRYGVGARGPHLSAIRRTDSNSSFVGQATVARVAA